MLNIIYALRGSVNVKYQNRAIYIWSLGPERPSQFEKNWLRKLTTIDLPIYFLVFECWARHQIFNYRPARF